MEREDWTTNFQTEALLARAAWLEEGLNELCLASGLRDKAVPGRFSTAGCWACWAQAGNVDEAINGCDNVIYRFA